MLDLDNFKAINDQHGHAFGDKVLQSVGRSLADAGRSVDRYGRWGGDEFVVLLNDCAPEDADETRERFRHAIEQELTTDSGSSVSIRCSVGAASYRSGVTSAELLEEADEAMYRDKRKRRESGARASP
jgi:diguanylate cyclase (GGDEF)-like protein